MMRVTQIREFEWFFCVVKLYPVVFYVFFSNLFRGGSLVVLIMGQDTIISNSMHFLSPEMAIKNNGKTSSKL